MVGKLSADGKLLANAKLFSAGKHLVDTKYLVSIKMLTDLTYLTIDGKLECRVVIRAAVDPKTQQSGLTNMKCF